MAASDSNLRAVDWASGSFFGLWSGEKSPNLKGAGCGASLAEQELSEVREVAAPDHPSVHAGCFDVGVLDVVGVEPLAELAVDFDQAVFSAAGDPQQPDLRIGPGVKIGEFLLEFRRETTRAESANPGKFVEGVQAREQRFGSAHGQPGNGAGGAASVDTVFGFHPWHDFGEESFAKLIEIAVGDGAVAEGAGVGLQDIGFTVSEGHNDEHRLGFSGGDEVIEDEVSAADGGPATGIVAVSVKQVQDWIGLFAARVVARWSVNVIVAMIADYAGFVEMMMQLTVRDIGGFPCEARRTGNVQFASAIQEIRLNGVIGRIEVGDSVHLERIAIKIGSERIGSDAPDALIVSLHGQGLRRAFDGNGNFLGVRGAETEDDPIVGMNLRRNYRRRRSRARHLCFRVLRVNSRCA